MVNLLCTPIASTSCASSQNVPVHRKVLRQAIAAVCKQDGFESIESDVLELLAHMINSYILEIGITTRALTELAGRTVTTPNDVIMALIEHGSPVAELPNYLKNCTNQGTLVIASPKQALTINAPSALRIGTPHYHHLALSAKLPPLPDSHTYNRTEISGEPELTYEKVRDDSAESNRNAECFLKDFMLRIHPSISVFSAFESRLRRHAAQLLQQSVKLVRESVSNFDGSDGLLKHEALDSDDHECDSRNGIDGSKKEIFSSDHRLSAHVDEFELKETENSLVRRKLPSYCSVLEPSLDNRAYIPALLSDELGEDNLDVPSSPPLTQAKNLSGSDTLANGYLMESICPYMLKTIVPTFDFEQMDMT